MNKNYKSEFDQNGFILIKKIIPKRDIVIARKLAEQTMSIAKNRIKDPMAKYFLSHRSDQGVLYDLYQRYPAFRKLIDNKKLLDIVEEIVGNNFFLYTNSLITKPLNTKNIVPWHQDFISRKDEPIKTIIWIALNDTDKENGAIKIIPESHKKGFLPWHRVEGETHHDRVNSEFVDEKKAIYINMKAGDVLIFNMLLIHGSDQVNVNRKRYAFRCAIQSMNYDISVPRGIPIVLRGGTPYFLEKRHFNQINE